MAGGDIKVQLGKGRQPKKTKLILLSRREVNQLFSARPNSRYSVSWSTSVGLNFVFYVI